MDEIPEDFRNVSQNGNRGARARYWVWTLNNYTERELVHLRNIISDERVAFISWGDEVAPTTGTPHLQGHLELNSQLRWTQVRSLIGSRAWLAVRRGTFEQAQEYVEKTGTHESFGQRVSVGRGTRQDLSALKADLESGMTLRDVANEHFSAFIRYTKGILQYRLLHATPRTWRTEVIVYWGATDTGKTFSVYNNLPNFHDLWKRNSGASQWFDGYDDHPIALIDEFKPSQYDITYMLELLDRYPTRVPVKGGFVNWCPREIYITSNMDPSIWYVNALEEHRRALFRRIGHIVHFE